MDLATLTLCEYKEEVHHAVRANEQPKIRRARTREQGAALVLIGHAIEYLLDTGMFRDRSAVKAELEALGILQEASLSIYNDGALVKMPLAGLRRWFLGDVREKKSAVETTMPH